MCFQFSLKNCQWCSRCNVISEDCSTALGQQKQMIVRFVTMLCFLLAFISGKHIWHMRFFSVCVLSDTGNIGQPCVTHFCMGNQFVSSPPILSAAYLPLYSLIISYTSVPLTPTCFGTLQQHLSYDDCLEVLYCVLKVVHSHKHT